jgi:hypothetical protein
MFYMNVVNITIVMEDIVTNGCYIMTMDMTCAIYDKDVWIT